MASLIWDIQQNQEDFDTKEYNETCVNLLESCKCWLLFVVKFIIFLALDNSGNAVYFLLLDWSLVLEFASSKFIYNYMLFRCSQFLFYLIVYMGTNKGPSLGCDKFILDEFICMILKEDLDKRNQKNKTWEKN